MRRLVSTALAGLVATSLPLVMPSVSEAAPWSKDTVLFYDSFGEPAKAYGNFIPGTTTLEPGPSWGDQYSSPSVSKQLDGTYCFGFTLHAYLQSLEAVFYGEENASGKRYTLCGPPGTTSAPITLRKRDGVGYPARWYQIQGPVYITIGEYDVRPCAPREDGPEYEAAMASAVLFDGNVGTGRAWDPQYFPKTKWAYLDFGSGSCDANERLWYLVPVAEGAGKGFVVSDYASTCNVAKDASKCTEKFNGKTYDLLNKSVRKKMRCRNVELIPPAPTLAQTQQENPNIEDQWVHVTRRYVDGEPFGYDTALGLDDALCYKAPKSAGSYSFVRQSGVKGESRADRWETWCNVFLFCFKKFKPGYKISGFDVKSTTKFVFKQESVSAKKTKVKVEDRS